MKTTNLLMLAALLACSTADVAAGADPARAALSAQSKALMEAVKRGDAMSAARTFTRDARIIVPGAAAPIVGQESIEQFWRGGLTGGLQALDLATTEVSGDGAVRIETGMYQALGAQGKELGRGQYLLVWKLEGRDWKIFRDIASMSPMSPMSPPSVQPAAQLDPVTFPANYREAFKLLAVTARDDGAEVMTTYANPIGAAISRTDQLPYPDGSMFVMEFAAPLRDGEGQLLHDSAGAPLRGAVAHVDVMLHGRDPGGRSAQSRAGAWEFASFAPDGRTLLAPADGSRCAACHQRAGTERDFVFRPHNPLLDAVP
jgi:ketosteroid isomerase-like protein